MLKNQIKTTYCEIAIVMFSGWGAVRWTVGRICWEFFQKKSQKVYMIFRPSRTLKNKIFSEHYPLTNVNIGNGV